MMKNCEFYGLFDYTSGDGDTYEYTSAEWSHYLKGITGNGISKNALNEFAPSANGLAITIASGEAYIEGRYAYNTTATQFSLSPTSSGQKRYDRIVVELDEASRVIGLNVVAGTATSSTPAKPALTSKQLPICSILVENGSTTTLTDERTFTYSATTVQESFLPVAGGTVAGNLTVNGTFTMNSVLPVANGGTGGSTQASALKNIAGVSTNPRSCSITYASLEEAGIVVAASTTEEVGLAMADNTSIMFVHNTDNTIKLTDAPFNYGYIQLGRGYNQNYIYGWAYGTDGRVWSFSRHNSYAGQWRLVYNEKSVVYSSTEPTAGNGSIWLKPVS